MTTPVPASSPNKGVQFTAKPDVHHLVGLNVMAYPSSGGGRSQPPLLLPATIVDVKRLAHSQGSAVFLRWRDSPRRFAEWLPVAHIAPESVPADLVGWLQTPCTDLRCFDAVGDDLRAGFKNTIEFLEERLRRDMSSPNCMRRLHFLGHEMAPWYYSPYEVLYGEFSHASETLHDAFFCPFTLTPFESHARLRRHLASHVRSGGPLTVPGIEVYRDDAAGVSLMEVDGRVHTVFCRNVFLMAKCFLECKLVGHDTDLYMFYVVALHAEKHVPGQLRFGDGVTKGNGGAPHGTLPTPKIFAGYYTYERGSVDCNLACIVTLPCFQGRGLGRFLIDASYAIGYRKGIVGSPERPLSDLGRAAYDRFWAEKVWAWALHAAVEALEQRRPVQPGAYDAPPQEEGSSGALAVMRVTVHDVAKALRLDQADVLETVLRLGLVHRTEGKTLKLLIPVETARREVARVAAAPICFHAEQLGPVSTSIE
jgi:GNAT superfamily N-acetyltransferase